MVVFLCGSWSCVMKKFFSFFVLIFLIGLACSLVPLSLRLRLHNSGPKWFPTSAVIEGNLATDPQQNFPNPFYEAELGAKGEMFAKLTPQPLLTSTETTAMTEDKFANSQQFAYSIQMLTPIFTTNFVHLEEGCHWLGMSGQVFDINNQPVEGMVVAVTGKPGYAIPAALAYSGLAPEYGPGGYEVFLGNENLGGEYKVQLFDYEGTPLSAEANVSVPPGCDSNLIIINFIDSSKSNSIFLPLISR